MNITPRDVELALEALPEVAHGLRHRHRPPASGARTSSPPSPSARAQTSTRTRPASGSRRSIASYKVPRHIAVFADQTELPWLDSGKVDRRRLTAILDERFAGEQLTPVSAACRG